MIGKQRWNARNGSVAETGDHDWEPQITINLRAPALCAKALLPLLKKGPGHIVNLSSEGGFRPRSHCWFMMRQKLVSVRLQEYGL